MRQAEAITLDQAKQFASEHAGQIIYQPSEQEEVFVPVEWSTATWPNQVRANGSGMPDYTLDVMRSPHREASTYILRDQRTGDQWQTQLEPGDREEDVLEAAMEVMGNGTVAVLLQPLRPRQ